MIALQILSSVRNILFEEEKFLIVNRIESPNFKIFFIHQAIDLCSSKSFDFYSDDFYRFDFSADENFRAISVRFVDDRQRFAAGFGQFDSADARRFFVDDDIRRFGALRRRAVSGFQFRQY